MDTTKFHQCTKPGGRDIAEKKTKLKATPIKK